jgi:quinol monooxygenase YgiN
MKENSMIVEYLRYTVRPSAADRFEQAYQSASEVLAADPHCVAYELCRGVEEPEHFIVRLEWDSLEGHERGFRAGPHFAKFFGFVRPYFSDIAEMKHYTVRQSGLPGRTDTSS